MDKVVRRLTEARLHSYSQSILEWQSPEEIRDRLATETLELLELSTDEQLGRDRMARFPTAGVTESSDYMDAILTLPDGSITLTGIRYRGGDPTKPFVDVVALEGNVTESHIRDVIGAIDTRWGRFNPLCIRVFVPRVDTVDVSKFGPKSRVDLRIVAGRVSDIVAKSFDAVDGLSIRQAIDMSWHERYKDEYDRFLAADPRRRHWTQPEAYDFLAAEVGKGSAFLVEVHGDLAGVYVLSRATEHGLQGFRFEEKVLFESVRGKGFGASIEHAVVEKLTPKPDDVLFGTIEDSNSPSQGTAYRLGRVDIGAKLWITPPGRSGMPEV